MAGSPARGVVADMGAPVSDVTVVTPVGRYHLDLLERCTASVEAQTIPVRHVVILDEHARGAGWARNQGLAQVDTPFVVFLDADDWLEPTFVERCFAAYDGTRYLYTDWYEDGVVKPAPDCAWINRAWHCITTLLPTAWVRRVGGFEEQLPGAEDTALYLALTRQGMCGRRLAEPLFHYGKEGQRAKTFLNSPEHRRVVDYLIAQYGGKPMACSGCGDGQVLDTPPAGEPQAGDVLAQALWGGNRTVRGRVSARFYPRTSYPHLVWVDPRDVDSMPSMFRLPPAPEPAPFVPAPKTANGASAVAQQLNAVLVDYAPEPALPKKVERASKTASKPDVGKLVKAGKRAYGAS